MRIRLGYAQAYAAWRFPIHKQMMLQITVIRMGN